MTPADHTLIALDPDIPADRQMVMFETAGTAPSARWLLDGGDFGPASRVTFWKPRGGPHTLELVDAKSHPLSAVTFTVRNRDMETK